MTVATEVTTEYKTFTWQAVRKLAEEIGVPFYSNSSFSTDKGIGLKADRYNPERINVVGWERSFSEINEYMSHKIQRLSKENFMLKLQVWALTNNVKYEVVETNGFYHKHQYLMIEKA